MTDTTSPNDIDIIDDTNITTTTTTTTTNDDDDTFTIPPSINPTQPKNINKIYDRTTEDDPEVHPVLQKLTKHINGVEKAIKEIDDVIGQSMDFSLFSDDLQESMREVCPSDDPLDQEDFDPIAYLNEHFPDEASLNRADTFIANIQRDIVKTKSEIKDIIHSQANRSTNAHAQVDEAKNAIKQLYSKVKDIKSKAQESEHMVDEICHDIKLLDNAKTNLQTSITTLKRLHMLVTAVDQLEVMAEGRQYREAGNLLQAVNELYNYFQDYDQVPKIAELRNSVKDTKDELTKRILNDFKYIRTLASDERNGENDDTNNKNGDDSMDGNNNNSSSNNNNKRVASPLPGLNSIDQLSDACIVVNSLDPEIKERIIQQFCDIHLNVYDVIFRENGGEDKLETIERRYAWWRRTVRKYEEKYV